MIDEIVISANITVAKWDHGNWIIFVGTEHEDGRYLGFTKGFGSKAETMKVARQWARMSKSQLRQVSNLI